MTDAELVLALRSGSATAQAILYERYSHRLRRVLVAVLGTDDAAADLLHDVFTRAFDNIDSLEQPERLGAWLRSIAVFTGRAHIRGKRRHAWLLFVEPEALSELDVGPPHIEAALALTRVNTILWRLPSEERVFFALRFIDEMELEEVALATGVSLATAKRNLSRAKARFASIAAHDQVLRKWFPEDS